jgi:hypothetical protein
MNTSNKNQVHDSTTDNDATGTPQNGPIIGDYHHPICTRRGKEKISFLTSDRGRRGGRTWDVRSAAVKMAAAVTPLVSIGRASIRPRYHPTNPAPAPAPTTPVLLLDGTKAGAAMREGAPDGGHRGCGGDGLEEMRWERMRNQGEEGPIPQRSGTRRWPPAVAMATAAARGLQGSGRVGGEGGDGAHASVARSPLKLEWNGRPVFKAGFFGQKK